MEKLVDFIMTNLFQLAEYVCNKSPFIADKPTMPPSAPAPQEDLTPTIRFSNEDIMVEGDLFK